MVGVRMPTMLNLKHWSQVNMPLDNAFKLFSTKKMLKHLKTHVKQFLRSNFDNLGVQKYQEPHCIGWANWGHGYNAPINSTLITCSGC